MVLFPKTCQFLANLRGNNSDYRPVFKERFDLPGGNRAPSNNEATPILNIKEEREIFFYFGVVIHIDTKYNINLHFSVKNVKQPCLKIGLHRNSLDTLTYEFLSLIFIPYVH
jgi:hypothetical protein